MVSQPSITISLVVTTLGRVRDLEALLRTLAAQTLPAFEIIIVDQSGGTEIRQLLANFSAALPRINHIPTPRCGASRGRNIGVRSASGDIVAFPDDDCELSANLLEQIVTEFLRQPALDALVINTRAADGGPGMTRSDATGGTIDLRNLLRRCHEFGIVARRRILQQCQFDELIGTGAPTPWQSDEGPDLLARLLLRGCQVQYFPELVIFHPYKAESGTFQSVLRRSAAYGRGRGRLLHAYPFPKFVIASSFLRPAAGAIVSLLRLRLRRAVHRIGFSLGVAAGLLLDQGPHADASTEGETRTAECAIGSG